MQETAEFQYRVPWRATTCYPGAHRSVQRGNGYELHRIVPFYVAGDPRRFDVRATMRDPFGRLLVRTYKQRSKVPIVALADVSASMSFVGRTCKHDVLIQFVNALANSAHRTGDPFALTACDTEVRDDLSVRLAPARNAAALLNERLRHWMPSGGDASGLLAGAEHVPGTRSLIFLISDFHLPFDLLRDVLGRLSQHAVIPVVLVDTAEAHIPGIGITHVYDPETRAKRTLVLRRSFARRLEDKVREHHQQLDKCLADFNLRPLYLIDKFEPETVNRYFYE